MTINEFIEKWIVVRHDLNDKSIMEAEMKADLESLINSKPSGHRCRNCGTASKSVYCSVQCSEDAS
jgi:hypothetical protein